MEKLIRVIYVSRATARLTSDQLEQLLVKSQANNRRSGLTGMLTYWNGQFAQCLEGPPEDLDRILSKILVDPRHRDIRILSRQEIEERHFGSWSMHLINLDDEEDSTALVRSKYPKLEASMEIFLDPKVVFSLVFDLGLVAKSA